MASIGERKKSRSGSSRHGASKALIAALGVLGVLGVVTLLDAVPAGAEQRQYTGPYNAITDVPGIEVGHSTGKKDATGVTAALMEDGAVTGVDITGGAPATYNTGGLDPANGPAQRWGLFLGGGSSYGLGAGPGLVDYLQEQGLPPGASGSIIFDLGRGADADQQVQTSRYNNMGYKAAANAHDGKVQTGSVGGGTGALSAETRIKGGVGTASVELDDGTTVGALVVVNSLGKPYNDLRGCELFASYLEQDNEFGGVRRPPEGCKGEPPAFAYPRDGNGKKGTATTIGMVATDAKLDQGQATKLAQAANTGQARAIDPTQLPADGDTSYGVSTQKAKKPSMNNGEYSELLEAGADAYSRAIADAILSADSLGVAPTYCQTFEGACPALPSTGGFTSGSGG